MKKSFLKVFLLFVFAVFCVSCSSSSIEPGAKGMSPEEVATIHGPGYESKGLMWNRYVGINAVDGVNIEGWSNWSLKAPEYVLRPGQRTLKLYYKGPYNYSLVGRDKLVSATLRPGRKYELLPSDPIGKPQGLLDPSIYLDSSVWRPVIRDVETKQIVGRSR